MALDPDMTGPAPGTRQLLCVLGMHRSGTSVVTQLLHRLGAALAPQLLDAMGDVNDDGFWEDSRVVELNERLLATLASRWQDCEPLDFAADPEALAALRSEAVAHFRTTYLFADRARAGDGVPGLWVVKDPRLCRLLPFWLEVWQEAGFETCFVNVLRHPVAVAKSLQRRDRIPLEYGVALWLEYTLQAVSHSAVRPGIVVAFDAVAEDPLQLPRLLESEAGIRWPVAAARRQEAVASVVKPGLRHHDDSLPGRTGLRDLMAFAASTYAALCSPTHQPPGEARLAALCAEWRALQQRHRDELAMLRRTTDEIMALSAECVRIGTLHSEALEVIRGKDKNLEQLEQRVEERNRLIKDIAYFRFWRVAPRIIRRIKRR